MNRYKTPLFIALGVIILLISSSWLSRDLGEKTGNAVVTRSGLHRHTALEIYVDGVKQDIPASIGLGVSHQPMHTHDPDGVVHVEMEGAVKQKDIMLGKFFGIWGKSFDSFGTLESMTVNGKEMTAGENYVMGDKDTIVLRYVSATTTGVSVKGTVKNLESGKFGELVAKDGVFTVNVHTPYEGEIAGTDALIPYNTIAASLDKLPKDKNAEIALYCKSGRMSAEAAQTLISLGYTNVNQLSGGMDAWEKDGYAIEQKDRP